MLLSLLKQYHTGILRNDRSLLTKLCYLEEQVNYLKSPDETLRENEENFSDILTTDNSYFKWGTRQSVSYKNE